jgi:tryptophanyl-tRNA synthetase
MSPTAIPATARTTRRLTGLTPTGHLQLGNLIGAVRPMVDAQSTTAAADAALVMIADLSGLTVEHRPHEVRALTLEQATLLLAAGLDPDLTTIYVQSHVPEHTELHYLLECVASHGEMHRMIQFKEKSTTSGHTRLSLLTYPVLMAADILLYDTEEVPVGDDQTQHLELARDLATRFNNRYGDTFTLPRPARPEVAGRIMDLADPTTKMGKSTQDGRGVLYLLDPPDVLRHKIKRAVTDTDGEVRYDPVGKPGVSNLVAILAACTGRDSLSPTAGFTSYGQLKDATTEAVIDLLAPIQRRYHELARHPSYVRKVLADGAARARRRAGATVARTRRALGLLPK